MYEPKTKNVNVPNRAAYDDIYARSVNDPEGFWKEQADKLDWFHEPHRILDYDFNAVDFSWFTGGRLNAARYAPWTMSSPGTMSTS